MQEGSTELKDMGIALIVVNIQETKISINDWSTIKYQKSKISKLEAPGDPTPPEKQDHRSTRRVN